MHGGSAIVPYYISRELARRGHEVTTFSSDYKLSREWVESLHQVKVCPFKTWSSWIKFYVSPGIMNHARKEIKHFDLIHMHNYRTFQNIIVHHYAKKYGVPYILQAHGSLPRISAWCRLKWFYDILFGYRLLRDASKVIALSRVEVEQYKGVGVPEKKITIIPNGIDLSEYADLPPKGSFKKKFNVPEDKKIILYLGRIHKIKGIDSLVKAYAHLTKKMNYKDAVLVIAGPDDGFFSEVKVLIKTLKIDDDNVLLPGSLYGMNKLEAFVDAKIYVLPSRYETFPMTVLEAYTCGKPVIASNVGDLKDLVIDGETGLLFETGNFKRLAEKTFYLLNNEDEIVKIGKKARRFVEDRYSIERVVDMLEKLYMEVIS